MSVINQMLKDLESRRQSGDSGNNVLEGIAWHGGSQGSRRAPLLAIIVLLLVAAVSWLVYERVNNKQTASVQAIPTQQVPVVTKPVMTPPPVTVMQEAKQQPVGVTQRQPEPISPVVDEQETVVLQETPVPTISAISPEPVSGNGRRSEVIVRGSGFIEPLSVTLGWANGAASKQLDAYQIRVENDKKMKLFFNPGTRDDNWIAQVTNSDGESSEQFAFQVIAASGSAQAETKFETNTRMESEPQQADTVVKKLRAQSATERASNIYRKASEQLSRGEMADGEAGLRRALDLKTDLHAARELLAGLLLRQKRIIEAAQVLDEGLALLPTHTAYILLRARIYTEQGNTAKATSLLESQRPALQNAGDYYALLAALYQRSGRHADAAGLYTSMLERNPGQAVWHMGLGISLEALGDKTKARDAYQHALQSGLSGNDVRAFVKARLRILQ